MDKVHIHIDKDIQWTISIAISRVDVPENLLLVFCLFGIVLFMCMCVSLCPVSSVAQGGQKACWVS